MSAKLSTHIWSIEKWITYPVYLSGKHLKDTESFVKNGLTDHPKLHAS
jgi:hypothetical protein